MPNWDAIQKEWETTKITLTALADKHNVKLGTLKSRRSREGWTRNATKKDATISKRMQPKMQPKEPVIMSDDLTDKQRLFCIYYIKYFNATKAYQKAYECTYVVANVEGHRNLVKPSIKNEIDRLKSERTTELKLGVNDVLQKYIDIAFADITDFATFGKKEVEVITMFGPLKDENDNVVMKEVNYVDLNESTKIDGTIVTEVKQGQHGVSVKLADKMKALEMLTKYFDMLPESQRRRLEEEKMKLELAQMTGDSDNDAHEQGGSYEDALNAQVEDVFADEET